MIVEFPNVEARDAELSALLESEGLPELSSLLETARLKIGTRHPQLLALEQSMEVTNGNGRRLPWMISAGGLFVQIENLRRLLDTIDSPQE